MKLPKYAIETKNLNKTYKAQGKASSHLALKDINLSIPRGSIFGFLGPNGAGKSTFINILAGLVLKTSGNIKIWDIDIDKDSRKSRNAIGIVPQELNLDAFFTPWESLDVQAGLYGVPKKERITDELLEAVGLTDKAHVYSRTLSGGMRRRLMVAKAMVHRPPILVLDEPTAGVDVELRKSLWDYIKKLHKLGTTIILTTHYLEEAEELCDSIAIINNGEIVACDKTKKLIKGLDRKILHITLDRDITDIPHEISDNYQSSKTKSNQISIEYAPSKTPVGDILANIQASNLNIVDISTEESDLEDIFLKLTQK